MNNFEKPLTLKSALEKRDTNRKKRKLKEEDLLTTQEKRVINQVKSQVVLEAPEKKRRISKKAELLKEDFHGENETSIFTGPENLPFERETEPVDLDDLEFKHIIGKEELLPTPEDEHEEFLISEFKTLDPDIIQETIRERVESGEYTESPVEDTRFSSGPMRTKIDSDYGRYRSLNGVTQEELDHEHFANYEMLNVNKEPLTAYEDMRERAESPKAQGAGSGLWKNFKKWLSDKNPDMLSIIKKSELGKNYDPNWHKQPDQISKTKTENWMNKFLKDKKEARIDNVKIKNFIEKQHKLASIEDDFYSEQEHPFEEKFEKEIKEEAVIEQAAEEQKENLILDQEEYDAKIAAEWAPFIKEKAAAVKKEQYEDAETIRQQVESLSHKVVIGSARENGDEPHEHDEFAEYEQKVEATEDARDAVQIKLDNELKKTVRKTGRAPRGSLKNVHIPMEE